MKAAISQLIPISPCLNSLRKSGSGIADQSNWALSTTKDPRSNFNARLTRASTVSSNSQKIQPPRRFHYHLNSKGNLLLPTLEAIPCIQETVWGLECAAKLGATAALHTLGRFTPELYYEDAYKNAVQNLKIIAPVAEKLNVALSVEFVWSGFLFSPVEMRRFLDEVGSTHVGFYFDPGNMAVFQYPQHWVRAIGKHVKRVHLKDFKGGPLNGVWTRLGEGACDFKAIFAELKKIGYDGPLVSEVATSLASLKDTADDIKSQTILLIKVG